LFSHYWCLVIIGVRNLHSLQSVIGLPAYFVSQILICILTY